MPRDNVRDGSDRVRDGSSNSRGYSSRPAMDRSIRHDAPGLQTPPPVLDALVSCGGVVVPAAGGTGLPRVGELPVGLGGVAVPLEEKRPDLAPDAGDAPAPAPTAGEPWWAEAARKAGRPGVRPAWATGLDSVRQARRREPGRRRTEPAPVAAVMARLRRDVDDVPLHRMGAAAVAFVAGAIAAGVSRDSFPRRYLVAGIVWNDGRAAAATRWLRRVWRDASLASTYRAMVRSLRARHASRARWKSRGPAAEQKAN